MGINLQGARALCFAKRIGIDFTRTATIARQGLALDRAGLARLLQQFGAPATESGLDVILSGTEGYAEALFQHLGAQSVESFDVSPYERATHIHDMNQPIGRDFYERYTTVFDGGSLEHIFNVPTALRNCMEMVAVGGRYISILPANNFFGHGFYQFSPELFFNVFSTENGFEVEAMFAFDDRPDRLWRSAHPDAVWRRVKSPIELGERVTLANADPVSLIVIARRTERRAIFAQTPQQSDYSAMWKADAARTDAPAVPAAAAVRPLPVRILKAVIPAPLRQALRNALRRPPRPIAEGFEARFFEPFDPRTQDLPR